MLNKLVKFNNNCVGSTNFGTTLLGVNFFYISLDTENKSPSLLNSGDRYEEDLKIRIWKMTLT